MYRRFQISRVLVILALACWASFALADDKSGINQLSGSGVVAINESGDAVVLLHGNASQLGKFTCSGQLVFQQGNDPGSIVGEGVAAFTAANGDQLVGTFTWQINADGSGEMKFHWHDSITLGDGSTVESTGRFADRRPPGIVVRSATVVTGSTSGVVPVDGISI
jgi:hypothetical protein